MRLPYASMIRRALHEATPDTPAARLLAALRVAGSRCFLVDDDFVCSPPARHVEWDGAVEAAIDLHRAELAEIVRAESSATIH